MRKLSVGVATMALAAAGCGSQAQQSSASTTTTVGAAPSDSVAVASLALTAPAKSAASSGVVAVAHRVNARPAKSIVGTWSGYITPSPGSHASRQRFFVVVDPGERAGRWRIGARCSGTLSLENISDGYHHFYRLAGANAGCAPLGVDCLKRAGAQVEDVFSSGSGWGDSTIYLRRVSLSS